MVSWIIDKKDDLNIKYVFHTGDIADEFNEEYQFAFARSQQKRLEDAGIPTGVLGGNHDVAHGNMVYDLYWKYFGEEYYKDKSYYGGSYKNNLGHYDVVEVDGEEILFISISWDIYTYEIAWINSVLDAHPGTRAIITTHGGINATATESYTSRILLNGVCKNHPQVMAILNGHYHGSSVNFVELTSDSGEKHTVYQICTDYQSADEGGSGYIKMLYFDLANDKIYLNSYSPAVPSTGMPDFNYYDDKTLVFDESMMTEDDNGVKRYSDYDIDIVTLPVDFDRETEKTLTKSATLLLVLRRRLSPSAVSTAAKEYLPCCWMRAAKKWAIPMSGLWQLPPAAAVLPAAVLPTPHPLLRRTLTVPLPRLLSTRPPAL